MENDKIVKNLTEEMEKHKKHATTADNLRTSLVKKEAYIKSLRVQSEKHGKESEELKTKVTELVMDSEKKIKYVLCYGMS